MVVGITLKPDSSRNPLPLSLAAGEGFSDQMLASPKGMPLARVIPNLKNQITYYTLNPK